MGLFDSVRGLVGDDEDEGGGDDTPDVPRLNVRDPTPMDFQNKAVDAVSEWDDQNLDYSLDSLERLDAFARKQGARLDAIRDQSDDDGARVADMHTGFTIRAGSYFGEVLVRQLDGDWTEHDGTWVVMVPTGEDAQEVDVFEVASHSFAQQPLFVDLATELGADLGDEDDSEDDELEAVDLRPDFRPDAEEFAAFWDQYDLDFTAVSLARLDVLTDSEWDDDEFDGAEAGGGDMDSKMYTELVKQLGSYYGEVLVRELDGEWTRRNGAAVVVVPGPDDEVTVPIFDAADAGLTDGDAFAEDFTDIADRVGVDRSVPTQAGGATVDDIDAATADDSPAEAGAPADQSAATDDHPAAGTGGTPDAEDDPLASSDGAFEGTDEGAVAEVDDGVAGGTDSTPAAEASDAGQSAVSEASEGAQADTGSENETGGESVTDAENSDTATESPVASPADILGVDESEVADAADIEMDEGATDPDDGGDDPSPVETDESESTADGPADTDTDAGEMAADEAFVESMLGEGESVDDETTDDTTDEAIPRVDDGDSGDETDDDAPEQLDLGDGGGGDEGPSPADLQEDAAAFAATWPGHDLDFTPESLERLDRLVAEEYDAADVPDVDLAGGTESGYLAARVVEAGGYFAEVLRRRFGGQWREQDGGLVFVVDGQQGTATFDPAAVATDCFRGDDSFAARYGVVCNQLSVSE